MKKTRMLHQAGLLAVALSTAVLFLAGCQASQKTKENDVLIIGTTRNPATFDPSSSNDIPSNEIIRQIFDTLLVMDYETMEPVPSLAERYALENHADGQLRQIRLFLKQGVLFHNGDEMKASDVKFSLERAAISPQSTTVAAEIEGVDIIDDYQVVIILKEPYAPMLRNLTQTQLAIVSERAVQELGNDAFAQNPVGTGPMKFVKYQAGDRVELTRWDGYWGEAPRMRNITFRIITDIMTQILELETGGVDIINSIPAHDIARIEANPNLQVFRRPNTQFNYMGMNNKKAPFNDARVRRAIVHAIDREALIANAWPGVGKLALGPMNSTLWAAAGDQLPPTEYNPEKARQLLAEAGYPNGFSTTLATNELAERVTIAQITRNMLAQVGINVDIQIMEWAAYLDWTARGEHDMFLLGWVVGTGDPHSALEIYNSRSHGTAGNRSFISNPSLDRLLNLARAEMDSAKRYDMYIEAQKIINNEMPVMPTWEGEVLAGARADLRGFSLTPANMHHYWTIWFEE